MARHTTRVQTFNTDTVFMLAVQGKGAARSKQVNRPQFYMDHAVVLNGNIKVTRINNPVRGAHGFSITMLDKRGKGRTHYFRADAMVRLGDRVVTLMTYWHIMDQAGE